MVTVPVEGALLTGDLVVSGPTRSVVLFAHGGASTRNSPRSRDVAHELHKAGIATLLLDLLSELEERNDAVTGKYRFDIPRLAHRLVTAIDWLDEQPDTARLPVGLFASGTAAAAALLATAERPDRVYSVVSQSGRPDLAGETLPPLRAPVLFFVGGNDQEAVRLNRESAEQMQGPHKIHLLRGVTRVSEEPEALRQVAAAAREWFVSPLEQGGDAARPSPH
ncbi:dienelactone hydrolase family protein [Streptomyces sp. NPDC006602]|uniref:dienelactone hydrolase family protein n=1 Tax=Streptomyces sp. NPDC006602 TaxID=3364751 RepID=UPI0036AB789C